MPEFVGYWSTVLDIIEAGMNGNTETCRMYALLLASRLRDHGDEQHAQRIVRLVDGIMTGVILKPMENADDLR